MFTPETIWGMIGGGAVVVFGAGQLVEKVRNGKYVPRETCGQIHLREDERWKRIEDDLNRIRKWIDGEKAQE